MEKDEELNIWNEAMTPRRTINNFFAKATPVDSPDVEEIFEHPEKYVPPEEEEATPVAGNSQNSQRSRVLKRKFGDEEESFGNISKKNVSENQTTSLHNDSTFGTSEILSNLDSPSLVIPPRPPKKDKRRVSTTDFVEVIKSQQTQVVNTSDNVGESSIPSALGSPEEVLSQRLLRSKKHTSVSMFQETLGGKHIKERFKKSVTMSGLNESDLESSGNPSSNLESPEYVSSQNRFIHKSKPRRSITAFNQVLEKKKKLDSEEILPSLDSPEKEQPVDRFVSKSKARRSATAFNQVLENQKEQDSEEILPSLDSPEKKQPVDRFVSKSKARRSATAFNQVLENRKEQDSEEILPSLGSPEKEQPVDRFIQKSRSQMSTTAFLNVLENEPNEEEVVLTEVFPDLQQTLSDEQDYSDLPHLEAVENFPSVSSSSQIINSKWSTQNSPMDRRKETLNTQSDKSHKDGSIGRPGAIPVSSVSNNSTIETPFQLDSPNKQYIRPGPASYKKRVSATGFLDVLNKKNDVVSSSDSHVKEPIQETSIREVTTRHETPIDEEIEMGSRPSSRMSNKSSSSLSATERRKISLLKLFEAEEKKETISDVIRNINESVRSVYPASPTPASPKSRDRLSKSNDSDSDNELLFSKTEILLTDKTAKITRSASRASDSTSVSKKSSSSDGTKQRSIISDDGDSDNEILSRKTETPSAENTSKISRNASRASNKTLALTKSNDKTTLRSKSNDTDSDNNLPFSKTETPQLKNTTKITRSASRGSKRKSTSTKSSDTTVEEGPAVKSSRAPNKSLPKFSKIVLNSESESENSEVSLSMPITEHTSTKIPSPLHATIGQPKLSSSSSSFGSRSRKTLNFDSTTTKVVSTAITTLVDHQPLIDEAGVEETSSSDTDTTDQIISEEEKSTEEIEDEEELSEKSKGATHSLRASAGMSPSNRYPALKNSTVVAGGAAFYGAPLSMSPIKPDEHGAPLLLLSTPKSSEAGTMTGTDVKSPTPKTVQKISSHPSTPAPFGRKRTSSITQSPMFINVMKSSVKKAISNVPQNQQRVISATPTTSRVSVAKTAKSQQSLVKGLSTSNPRKGKSIVVSPFDKMPESSDTEWEDEEVGPQPKPRCINIAFEEIEDRSKDFVPLEKRLMADPVFQAKVKFQRSKVAAEKAADEAVAAAKKNDKRIKPRTVVAKKKEEDNIANMATNKGNLRFYARTKVSKEALDAVHGLVGEWFDFTLDQMENFCIDEGISSLNSWEDCYKMMKRQGIVKNYMEYSGLCHSLLLNDECAQLLPSSYPPEFYDWKREAKRLKK